MRRWKSQGGKYLGIRNCEPVGKLAVRNAGNRQASDRQTVCEKTTSKKKATRRWPFSCDPGPQPEGWRLRSDFDGSEVVGDAEASVTRGRRVQGSLVVRLDTSGVAGARVDLQGLAAVEHVEHRDVEGQLLVGPHRTVLGAQVEQVQPGGVTHGARRRRLTVAVVVAVLVTDRIGL